MYAYLLTAWVRVHGVRHCNQARSDCTPEAMQRQTQLRVGRAAPSRAGDVATAPAVARGSHHPRTRRSGRGLRSLSTASPARSSRNGHAARAIRCPRATHTACASVGGRV